MASESISQMWNCVRGERAPAMRRALNIFFAIAAYGNDSEVPEAASGETLTDMPSFEHIMLDTKVMYEVVMNGFALRRLPQCSMLQSDMSIHYDGISKRCTFRRPHDDDMLKVSVDDGPDDVTTSVEHHARLNLASLAGTAGFAFNGVANEARSGQKVSCCSMEIQDAAETPEPLLPSIMSNALADIDASDIGFQTSRMILCTSDFGSPFSASCSRAKLFSLQLLRLGAPRLCIVIAPESKTSFVAGVKSSGNASFMCSQAVEHQGVWPTVAWLDEMRVEYRVIWQEAHEIVILSPDAYLYGLNTGSHVLETLHYAPPGWNSATADSEDYQFCRGSCDKSVGYFYRNMYHTFASSPSVADESLERQAAQLLAARRGNGDEGPSRNTRSLAVSSHAPIPPHSTASPSTSQHSLSKKRKQSSMNSEHRRDQPNPALSLTCDQTQGSVTAQEQERVFQNEIEEVLSRRGMVGPPGFAVPEAQLAPSKKKRRLENVQAKDGHLELVREIMGDIEVDLASLEEVVGRYTQESIEVGFGVTWGILERFKTAIRLETLSDISRVRAHFQYSRMGVCLDSSGVSLLQNQVRETAGTRSEEVRFWATLVEHCSIGILLMLRKSYKAKLRRVGKPTVIATIDAVRERFYDVRARSLEPLSAAILAGKPREEVLALLTVWQNIGTGGLLNPHKFKSQLLQLC